MGTIQVLILPVVGIVLSSVVEEEVLAAIAMLLLQLGKLGQLVVVLSLVLVVVRVVDVAIIRLVIMAVEVEYGVHIPLVLVLWGVLPVLMAQMEFLEDLAVVTVEGAVEDKVVEIQDMVVLVVSQVGEVVLEVALQVPPVMQTVLLGAVEK